MSANDPIADFGQFRLNPAMTKLFYGSYVVSGLLALLQFAIYALAYFSGWLELYFSPMNYLNAAACFLLMASIFFRLKLKIAALLIFSMALMWQIVPEVSAKLFGPASKPFVDDLSTVIFLLFCSLLLVLGSISGVSLLRRQAEREE